MQPGISDLPGPFLSDTLKGLVPLSGRKEGDLARVVELLSKDAPDGVEEIVLRLTDALGISEDAALSLYRSLNYVAGEGADAALEAPSLLDELGRAVGRSSLEDGEKAGLAALFEARPNSLGDLLDPFSRWRAVQKKQDLIGGIVNSVEGLGPSATCGQSSMRSARRSSILGLRLRLSFS